MGRRERGKEKGVEWVTSGEKGSTVEYPFMTVTIGNQLYVPYNEVSLTQRFCLFLVGMILRNQTLLSTTRLASSPGHSQILSCS